MNRNSIDRMIHHESTAEYGIKLSFEQGGGKLDNGSWDRVSGNP